MVVVQSGQLAFLVWGFVVALCTYYFYRFFSRSAISTIKKVRLPKINENKFRQRDKLKYFVKRFLNDVKQQIIVHRVKGKFVEYHAYSKKTTNLWGVESVFFKGIDKITEDFLPFLKSMYLYGLFSQKSLLSVCHQMKRISYSAGDLIFSGGNIDIGFLMIESGFVDILYICKDGRKLCISRLGPGDSLHSSLHLITCFINVDCRKYSIEALVQKDATVYTIDTKTFCNVLKSEPNMEWKMLEMAVFRFHHLSLTILNKFFGLTTEITSKKSKIRNDISTPECLELSDCELIEYAVKQLESYFESSKFNQLLHEKGSLIRFDSEDGCNILNECNFYFNIYGLIEVIITNETSGEAEVLVSAEQGSFVGNLTDLIGLKSEFKIRSVGKSVMFCLNTTVMRTIFSKDTRIAFKVGSTSLRNLSRFVRSVDFILSWEFFEAGKLLYKKNDDPDKVYYILNGRMRSQQDKNKNHTSSQMRTQGTKEFSYNEYKRGDVLGFVEALQGHKRLYEVSTVRDTEVGSIPTLLLVSAKTLYPKVVNKFADMLSKSLLQNLKNYQEKYETKKNDCSTLVVIPSSDNVPIENFCYEFSVAMEYIGSTCLLSSDSVDMAFSDSSYRNDAHEFMWLSHIESLHDFLIFRADFESSKWNLRCLRQSDKILIVCMANDIPTVSNFTKIMAEMQNITAEKYLVLLHDAVTYTPTPNITASWLSHYPWITRHFHVRISRKILSTVLLEKIVAKLPSYYESPKITSDICRVARILTGNAIGLVLSGGGARGYAHLGVIKYLEEKNIPIDMIGGTSMGAFVGGSYSINTDLFVAVKKCRQASIFLASTLRQVFELTIPIVSITTGHGFNNSIKGVFGDLNIEDLIIPFYCVSVDLTTVQERCHDYGCLWRYIRSSMSLPPFVPPVCDPIDGHLLLDGGIINNLPADIMYDRGACLIMAVDVGAADFTNYDNYGDYLSGFKVLASRYIPFIKTINAPTMREIQERLTTSSFFIHMENVKSNNRIMYLRPPIEQVATFQFTSLTAIMELGHAYMDEAFKCKVDELDPLVLELLKRGKKKMNYVKRILITDFVKISKDAVPIKRITPDEVSRKRSSKSKQRSRSLTRVQEYNSDDYFEDEIFCGSHSEASFKIKLF